MQLVHGKTLTVLLPKNGFPLSKFFDIAMPWLTLSLLDRELVARRKLARLQARNHRPLNCVQAHFADQTTLLGRPQSTTVVTSLALMSLESGHKLAH